MTTWRVYLLCELSPSAPQDSKSGENADITKSELYFSHHPPLILVDGDIYEFARWQKGFKPSGRNSSH